jgi:tRNA pseudouridine synthase 10
MEEQEEFSLCKACVNRQSTRKGIKIVQGDQCELCKGILGRIGGIAERIATKLETTDAEYKTFLIGTIMPKQMAAKEEDLWEKLGLGKECLKTELNREIGKLIEEGYKKYKYNPNPDVKAIYNLSTGIIDLELTPLYLFGKYKKLKRGIRQTKREDSDEPSVEEFICPILIEATRGEKALFHGHGREDIDVLMLGKGRPFIAEVKGPRLRKITLSELMQEINKKAKGNIEVTQLKYATGGMVGDIKRARFEKTYTAIIELESPITGKDLEKIEPRCVIMQKTPVRVLNRRADLVRKRRIKEIRAKLIDKNHIKLDLTTEAGAYVKEFISSDGGRTQPSISSMLGIGAKCKELNVLRIYSEWYEDFW